MFCPRLLFRQKRICWSVQNAAKSDLHAKVAETDNESYFVMWHPEKKFPYEYTKPLPVLLNKNVNPDSHLKMDSKDVYDVFKPKSPEVIREELMKITYTTKHAWFPRARDKFKKKMLPDRPYL